jgi:ketosteroid isomerase-like protein
MEPKKLLTILSIVAVVLIAGCKKDNFVEKVSVCPVVASTSPANAATNVFLNKIITATFNEEMNPVTITDASFTLQSAKKGATSEAIAGTVTYSDLTATFTPSSALAANTVYTGTIKTSVKDLVGQSLQTDYVWTFTTGTPPAVISADPANNATAVVLNEIIMATFNVPIDPLTLTTTTFTVKQGVTPVAGTVWYTGTTVSFTPASNLLSGTTYTATISTGVKNVPGLPMANDYVWTFTTGTITAPTAVFTDPANNATGVLLNQIVAVTFSMPMDPLTLTGTTFTLKKGVTPITGTVSYTGIIASFTPSGNLLPGTTYTATITTGAQNVPGTPLTSDYVWTFTTVSIAPPTVISTDPANNATGIPLNKTVTAAFSAPMDPLTLTATTFTVTQGVTPVAGTVSYTGTTASFIPTSNLVASTVYTATITTGAKSILGTAMAIDYVWTFTSGTLAAPTVISTDPVNNTTGIVLNKVVKATFSAAMDPLTLTATTFTLKLGATTVAGSVTYTGTTASFTPTSNLLSGTTYKATITTGAKNVAGTPLANDFVWTFTTVMAPTVISTDPANFAAGVVLNKVVKANFSTAMDPLTLTTTTFTVKKGATTVAGSVTYTGTTASFTPTSNLLSGITYTATITTGAKNVSGTALANDFVWTFTTVSAAPPTVISTDPANNATGVLLNKKVTAIFSAPMDPLTLTSTTFTVKQGVTLVAGTVSYTGTTASFAPTSNLLASTVYTATITTGAKSVLGTALANDYVWTFTTGALVAPTVISTDPLNNATGVVLNKIVKANFSTAMDPLTLTGTTFTVKQGVTPVAGTVSYTGTTASFTPTSNLLSGTTYTATITTGAKNVAGTPLANNYVWSFSTNATPPLGPGVVNLGTAGDFVAIGKSGISTTGVTSITGDIGVSPAAATAITGFGLIMDATNQFATTPYVTGKVYASDYAVPTPAKMTTAVSDMENALTTAMGLTTSVIVDLYAGDISGRTLVPGLYKWSTGVLITNAGVTLSGGPNDTWVFQIAQDLTVNNSAIVTLSGGAQAKNIFWVTATQATLGTNADFSGNVLSQTLISLNTGAKILGRCLAQTAVTLNASTLIKP